MCKGSEAGKTKCFLETERKKAWLEQLNKRDVGRMRDVGKTKKFYFLKNYHGCYVHCTVQYSEVNCQEKAIRNQY